MEPDSDALIASTIIRRTAVSAGQAGLRSVFVDQPNLFTVEVLTDQGRLSGKMNLTVDYNLVGRRPADVLDSLRVLSAWRAPNRLALALPFGPRNYGVVATIETDRDGDSAKWALVCQSLAQIQDHVAVLLKMPEDMSGDDAASILEAAKLLSGEAVSGSLSGAFTVHHQAAEPEIAREYGREYEFVAIKDIEFPLGSDTITAGKQALFFRGRYTHITPDHSTIEPFGEGVSSRYDGDLDVTRVLARPGPKRAIDAAN